MDYGLARIVLDSFGFIELSFEEYTNLVRAKDDLRAVLNIEEQFDVVLGNYVELETDLLATAMRSMVYRSLEYEYIQTERNFIVNRRFLNLLSACRAYLDQTDHNLNTIVGADGTTATRLREMFDVYRKQEYNSFLGFRVMEALRNYTQHRAFPIAIVYRHGWSGEGDARRNISTFIPYIEVDELDRRFKKSVREELQRLGERLDLRPMMRQYIGSLGSIHEKMREILKSYIDQCESTVRNAIERFSNEYPDEGTTGLAAVIRDEQGAYKEYTPMLTQSINYRRVLEGKNRHLSTIPTRHVTNADI